MGIALGVVADDFTGATDVANTLVAEGMRTVQFIGVPEESIDPIEADAVVIALKSRTIASNEAIAQSLAALKWLQRRGVRQVLQKYCSTFDSTTNGNIGPVADAMMAQVGTDFAVICPAFPANARTIYKGNLFVGDLPLAESSMKDHPLTPMRDSSLIRLMDAQSTHTTGLVPLEVVRQGAKAIKTHIAALSKQGHRYGVVDAVNESDLRAIGESLAGAPLVTGGSGIAMGLPANLQREGVPTSEPLLPGAKGRFLILAGSCSKATREQIAKVVKLWPSRKFTVEEILINRQLSREISQWAIDQPAHNPVLIYASADPAEVAAAQEKYGRAGAGELVENVMKAVAAELHGKGFNRVIVAGGETSGAVVSALNVNRLEIGPEITPGVPWCSSNGLAIALKSGNFGGPDFLSDAVGMLS